MAGKPKKIRILLTGGGTGGHIYPLVAVARHLSKLIIEAGFDADIRYFGDPANFKFYLEDNDIRIVKIASSKWRRYFDIKNFLDIFKFFWGLIQGLWKIYWFMPQICFSKGGPGALAVIVVSRFYAIPLVIHESDAVPGLTNKYSSKTARVIELAFAGAKGYFKTKAEMHLVGNPVRQEILNAPTDKMVKAEFGFNPDQPVVLVIGGSQGAERLNDFVFENLRAFAQKFQILHQVGPNNFAGYKKEYDFMYGREADLKNRYIFVPYFDKNIGKAYAAADVIVGRGGASTIFEVAALGKPSILIPLPESANNHQVHNAYEYEKAGGGIVIEEENLLVGLLITQIEKILADKNSYASRSQAARNFYIPDSAKMIADDILQLILK